MNTRETLRWLNPIPVVGILGAVAIEAVRQRFRESEMISGDIQAARDFRMVFKVEAPCATEEELMIESEGGNEAGAVSS